MIEKIYLLEKGVYSNRVAVAFSSKEDLNEFLEDRIAEAFQKYKQDGYPFEYRNAKQVNFPTWEAFREDRKMEYNITEFTVQ